ncbi:MAG: hypothetical protein HAW62_00895 [Endozoicomonadaceae bacterium]|nr:hypothetical protein [Endozoicomonadaceae bacterium]
MYYQAVLTRIVFFIILFTPGSLLNCYATPGSSEKIQDISKLSKTHHNGSWLYNKAWDVSTRIAVGTAFGVALAPMLISTEDKTLFDITVSTLGATAAHLATKIAFDFGVACTISEKTQKKHPNALSIATTALSGGYMGYIVSSIVGSIGGYLGYKITDKATNILENYYNRKLPNYIKGISTITGGMVGSILGSTLGNHMQPAVDSLLTVIKNTNYSQVIKAAPISPISSSICKNPNGMNFGQQKLISQAELEASFNRFNIISSRHINDSLALEGCNIPLTDISSITTCQHITSSDINLVFRIEDSSISNIRSNIAQLDKLNHCSCGNHPLLGKQDTWFENHALPGIQISAGTYDKKTIQQDLMTQFVMFNDIHKTQIDCTFNSENSLETILDCIVPVDQLALPTCIYQGLDFPAGTYSHVNNQTWLSQKIRNNCCQQSYTTPEHQNCCQHFQGENPMIMNQAVVSLEKITQDLFSEKGTYILLQNADPQIESCPEHITFNHFSDLFDRQCDYVSARSNVSSDHLKKALYAQDCHIDKTYNLNN